LPDAVIRIGDEGEAECHPLLLADDHKRAIVRSDAEGW